MFAPPAPTDVPLDPDHAVRLLALPPELVPEPPAFEAERLAENVLVPVDGVDDPGVIRLAARLAMAKGGNVLVGALAVAPGEQLEGARDRAREGERAASALGAEASPRPSATDRRAARRARARRRGSRRTRPRR